MVIAGVALVTIQLANLMSASGRRWFMHLRRPRWLTFEWAIPVIWTVVFICGTGSAWLVWRTAPGTRATWGLMGLYWLVEVAIALYTPVTCKLRSLVAGTVVGATGTLLGAMLAVLVWPLSRTAFLLLWPYLIWSPIGTYVTWAMVRLNPGNA
ncbi:MAG: TspO protein [Spirulinaceae cyanobacterium RM2_2_10]|nr:TspO protein [Spirulinaceae cyanobacterium SM2_1_0]NJO20124.1 TspO protein [Spirulinaceae cyanobacterium RM2_2_10]